MQRKNLTIPTTPSISKKTKQTASEKQYKTQIPFETRSSHSDDQREETKPNAQASDAAVTYFTLNHSGQPVAQSQQSSPNQLEPISKQVWKGNGSVVVPKNLSLSGIPSSVLLQNAGSTPSLLSPVLGHFSSQTQPNPIKLKENPGKTGSFIQSTLIKQNANNAKALAEPKKLKQIKPKPTLADTTPKTFAQHSEYLNTPTQRNQQQTERDKRGSNILSPHIPSSMPNTKRKYEVPYKPINFGGTFDNRCPSMSDKTNHSKLTPETNAKIARKIVMPDHTPNSRQKQNSNGKLPQVKLVAGEDATPTKTLSETFESYKSEQMQVEIVQDEDLVNKQTVYNKVSFASNQQLYIDQGTEVTQAQKQVKLDKQSLIIVRKHHLEIKDDYKNKERPVHKSFITNDKLLSSAPLDPKNAQLVKNTTDEIKKQMKPVISMQQIIVPTSHNQSNSQIDNVLKNNIFSKTFHQNENGIKKSTFLPAQGLSKDLLEVSKEKTALGQLTLRQELQLGKISLVKGSSSSQVQFVKHQLPPCRDLDLPLPLLSDTWKGTKVTDRASPLRDIIQSKNTHRVRESKVTLVDMLQKMAETPKANNTNALKKTERLIKTKLKGKPEQYPNKSQKTLVTKPEESKSRRQSVSKPESRVSSSGAQAILQKRGNSPKNDETTKYKSNGIQQKHIVASKANHLKSSQIGKTGQSEHKKGIQVQSYSTFNTHQNTQKISLFNSEFLLSADSRPNKRSLLQLEQPIIPDQKSSSLDSIAETYKDGVCPNRKFKINQEKSQPRIDVQKAQSEMSDDSAASCLIPSESEKVEMNAYLPKDLRKQQLAIQQSNNAGIFIDQLERITSPFNRLKMFGSAHFVNDINWDSDCILPGQASKSLLEKDKGVPQQIVNEVRAYDQRAHKALSFVGNGMFNMEQLRSFNHTDLDKKGKSSFRKKIDKFTRENSDQKYVQVVGPGSLIANSNSNRMRQYDQPISVQATEEAKDCGQKYQPPQFLTKEVQPLGSPAKKKLDNPILQHVVTTTPRDVIQASDKGSFVSQHIQGTASGPKIQYLLSDKKKITMASKGKDNTLVPKFVTSGQKSSSLLVPSKESANKSKQLLTGQQEQKTSDHDLNSARQHKETKSINSFIMPETKQKSFILPSAAKFTQKNRDSSTLSRDEGENESRSKIIKKTPSKTKQASAQKVRKLKVIQEENFENVSRASEKKHLLTNESEPGTQPITQRSKIIATIQHQIRAHFKKASKMPETLVEWYKIGKVMGKGAFGKVNLAIHRLATKFVALKSINKSVMKDEASKRKVMQEFNILRHTRHCNIVRLYESFETQQHIVFVMEVCGGGDLLSYVRKRHKLKEDVSKFLFKQIITGVKYINEKNVLHRDIKLDNILLTSQGDVKICDFGVSKLVAKNEMMFEQCGTPAYIAPEVFENKGYEGYASDIWSAGVVLYAMLYGAVPFKANNMSELHKQVLRCKPTYADNISESARNLLQAILERDPKKRLTANQVLEHPWMADAAKRQVHVFSEAEMQVIVDDFEYYNVRKENDPDSGQILPTDPFAEQLLQSVQNVDLKNISSRSVILAPFNSTRSHISLTSSDSLITQMMRPKNVIKFSAKVKEIDRQYELNNNAELDNGVYHHDDEQEEKKVEKYESHRGSHLDCSFNAEQLQSQLSELKLETEARGSIGFIEGQQAESLQSNDFAELGNKEHNELQQLQVKMQKRKKIDIKLQSESFEEVQVELYEEPQPSPRKPANKKSKSKMGSQVSCGPKEEGGTLILDESLLEQVEQAGFPKVHLVASLNNDELNYATTFYYLLKTSKEY